MNKNNLLQLFDKEMREEIEYPEARKEITADVVRFVREAPGMNFVSMTYAADPDLDRVIGNELAYFAPMDQPFTWKVYSHDLLTTLEERLENHHFVRDDDAGDVMILDLESASSYLFDPINADIRQITNPESLADVVLVLDKVYGNSNDVEKHGFQHLTTTWDYILQKDKSAS